MMTRNAGAHEMAAQGGSSKVQQRLDDCFMMAKLCTFAALMTIDRPLLLKFMNTLVNLKMGYLYLARTWLEGAIIQELADVFSVMEQSL